MANVYSRKLIDIAAAAPGYYPGPFVPSGFVWVIRALNLTAGTGSTVNAQNYLTANLVFNLDTTVALPELDIVTYQVLEEGDTLALELVSGLAAALYVSGYVLTLP